MNFLRNQTFVVASFVFIILFSLFCFSALADDQFLEVDQAFVFSSEHHSQGQSGVELMWNIADGYYLYKNKIQVLLDDQPITLNFLPEGTSHEDEYFGQQQVYKEKLRVELASVLLANGSKLTVRYQGCAEAGLCYTPITKHIQLTENAELNVNLPPPKSPEKVSPLSFEFMNSELGVSSFGMTLLMFFVLGLGLSFTPCVFPMYPILTGIIVGQNNKLTTRRAFALSFVYVQGMAVTYTAMGVIVAFVGMQFQAMFQHPVVLISLSVLFVFLALSMFGVFNLSLPSSLQQKLNNLSNNQTSGTYVGVALMGVISGLVASPCTTAPLTAALVYIAQSGDATLGGLALYSLSLGMGMPLIILGSSGGKLLPKAGGWMNVVKNVFGFLLLVVPIMLIERLLPEAWSLPLWLILAASFGGYLLNLNAQSKGGVWYAVRSILAFVVLFGAVNTGYQAYFKSETITSVNAVEFRQVQTLAQLQSSISESHGKYVLVDLYADWCVACKEFEHYTFTDPQVKQELAEWTLLQVDLTDSNTNDNQQLMSYYQVMGLPAILLFDENGQEMKSARISGFLNAAQFVEHLQKQTKKQGA
ncbi:MAG: protein-disulfide reductase DsbD [Gammaproteobacteria bacterium]|nr:protein-disulfide reductase DsbD [Gammaproteobacteria bacterium]